MFAKSITPILSRIWANTVISAYMTVPGGALVAAPKVHLLGSSPGVITPDTLLSALVADEANFSGYAAQNLTLAGPANGDNRTQVAFGSVSFLSTLASPFVTNNIYGYWIQSGTVLVQAELFTAPTPIPIANPGDFIDLSIFVPAFCY